MNEKNISRGKNHFSPFKGTDKDRQLFTLQKIFI